LLIVGYAYLEAKRRYSDAKGQPRFDELGATQLKRILDNTPHAQVLLYDYDAIAWNYDATRDAEIFRPIPTAHAVTLPMNLTLALGVRNAALYRYSVPFAFQLCYRYWQGLDLEMVGSLDELMARFEHSGPLPAFIMRRHVSRDLNGAPSLASVLGSDYAEVRPEEQQQATDVQGSYEQNEQTEDEQSEARRVDEEPPQLNA
jgi:hypothetical protein